MNNIDFNQAITAEDKASGALRQAQAAAAQTLITALSQAANAITGPVPQAERDSWPTKAAAALAVLDGTASISQTDMLGAERALTGETLEGLATSILAKADAYSAFAAFLAGLRRPNSTAIAAATTPDQVQAGLCPKTWCKLFSGWVLSRFTGWRFSPGP